MDTENIKKVSDEIVHYVITELHVHAILTGICYLSAHHIKESEAGIVASVTIVATAFVVKRKYPVRFFHLCRLDRAYSRLTGKIIVIDKKDYYVHESGFIIPHEYKKY